MSSSPAVSVVMPIHNGVPYLDDAIASILRQDFEDFELLILDDASTDGSSERIAYWAGQDGRVRVIDPSDDPLGLVDSSNRITREARADVIARLDADDVSRRDRLSQQLRVLEQHPGVSLVGCLARGIDAQGRVIRPRDLARLLPGCSAPPAPHSSWMFRRSAFEAIGGYLTGAEGWEDKALLYNLAKVGRVVTLAAPLVDVRYHARSTTVKTEQERRQRLLREERRSLEGGGSDGTIASDSYRLRAALRVWAGHRPDVVPRFPSKGSPRRFTRSLPILLYATWGKTSPRTLRAALRLGLRTRNAFLSTRFQEGSLIEWPQAHS